MLLAPGPAAPSTVSKRVSSVGRVSFSFLSVTVGITSIFCSCSSHGLYTHVAYRRDIWMFSVIDNVKRPTDNPHYQVLPITKHTDLVASNSKHLQLCLPTRDWWPWVDDRSSLLGE